MNNRRSFLRNSAVGLLGTSILPTIKFDDSIDSTDPPVVKQQEQGETFYVRENTPITIFLSKEKDSVSPVSICNEELQPGSVIPTHKHLHHNEYFIFHKGSGIVVIGDKETKFAPGSIAFIPKNTWHSIQNTGKETAFFTFGFTPGGFENYFKEVGTPKGIPFSQKSKEERDRIGVKYGMVFK